MIFSHTKAQRHKGRWGFGVLMLIAFVMQIGCATASRNRIGLQRFEFEEPQMGVPFRMVVYATNLAHAEGAVDAAFARIAAWRRLGIYFSGWKLMGCVTHILWIHSHAWG